MLEKAVSGPIESCRSISEVIVQLHKDNSVEDSSLSKCMAVCAGLKLHDRVSAPRAAATKTEI